MGAMLVVANTKLLIKLGGFQGRQDRQQKVADVHPANSLEATLGCIIALLSHAKDSLVGPSAMASAH